MTIMKAKWINKDPQSIVDVSDALTVFLNVTGALEKTASGINVKGSGISDTMLSSSFLKANGSTPLTAAWDVGGYDISNLPANPVGNTSAVRKDWVVSQIAAAGTAAEWQDSVLDRYDPTSGLPTATDGDRYLATATANGWTADYIYEGNGSTFDETIPTTGTYVSVDDESNSLYYYGGSSWVKKNFESNTPGDGIDITNYVVKVVVSELVGLGIEDDGANNFKIKVDSTGGANLATVVNLSSNGVAIKVDDNTIEENGTGQLGVKDNSIGATQLDETDNYTFTGTVNVPTQTNGDNSTKVASTAYVDNAISVATTSPKVDHFTLTGTDITNKYVTLTSVPAVATRVILLVAGAPNQQYSIDYQMDAVNTDRLTWDSLDLDGILEDGDKLTVKYDA